MGSSRPQTAGLAEKLRLLRTRFSLTQAQMVERLRNQKLPSPIKIYPGNISRFEQGLREPPPLILLAYARAAGISVEVLIDADFELPEQLALRATQESKVFGQEKRCTKTRSQRR